MENKIKPYYGRIPACGVFCGGCPTYTRDKKPCPGAEINLQQCEKCKSYHLCCKEKGISHCYQCATFPCYRFKSFATHWLKYGQNLIENQQLLQSTTPENFLLFYNSQTKK